MKTVGQLGVKQKQFFDDDALVEIYTPVYHNHDTQVLYNDVVARNRNVVLIIMESLSQEHIAGLNKHIDGYQGFTPFLDSLMNHSIVFNGFSNGKQSIEGIPSIISSLPSLMDRPYIISPYAGNKFFSLPGLLKQKGYYSAFYHGGTNGTMNFDGFAKMAGFDAYFGRAEYNNESDYDGNWGIFDEPYFQYFAHEMDKVKQPFFATLYSLSAHHPYTIPEKHKVKFRKGELEIQETIMYSDYALQELFSTLSGMDWYDSTLFVITADHTSEAHLPEYQNKLGMYRIPVIFFQPGADTSGFLPITASQVDIMPSILSLLNFDKSFVSFGNNLFDENMNHFAVNYINGNYQIIQGSYVLSFNGDESTGLHYFNKDALLKENLIDSEKELAANMEKLLKAYIQQYNMRMIENKLTSVK